MSTTESGTAVARRVEILFGKPSPAGVNRRLEAAERAVTAPRGAA